MEGILQWMAILSVLLSVATHADSRRAPQGTPNPITSSAQFDSLEGAYLAANSTAILLAYSMHIIDAVDAAIINSNADCFAAGYKNPVRSLTASYFTADSIYGELFTANACLTPSKISAESTNSTTYLEGLRFYAMQDDVELITLSEHFIDSKPVGYFAHSQSETDKHWHSESQAVFDICNNCAANNITQLQLYFVGRLKSNGWAMNFTLGADTAQPLIIKEVESGFRSHRVDINGGFSARIHNEPACQFAVQDFQTIKAPTIIGDAHGEWESDKSYPEQIINGEVVITFESGSYYRIVYQHDGSVVVNNQRLDQEKISRLKQRCNFLEGLSIEAE